MCGEGQEYLVTAGGIRHMLVYFSFCQQMSCKDLNQQCVNPSPNNAPFTDHVLTFVLIKVWFQIKVDHNK